MFIFSYKFINDLIAFKQSAYLVFYQRYYNLLVRFALTYISNLDDCKDVVSILISSLRNDLKLIDANTMINEKQFIKWLYVNLKHRCLRFIDNKKRKAEVIYDMDSLSNDKLISNELSTDVYIIFDDELREIFFLRHVSKHDISFIAEYLNMHESSIKRRLAKIEKILKDYFGG